MSTSPQPRRSDDRSLGPCVSYLLRPTRCEWHHFTFIPRSSLQMSQGPRAMTYRSQLSTQNGDGTIDAAEATRLLKSLKSNLVVAHGAVGADDPETAQARPSLHCQPTSTSLPGNLL